ncbi:MAG: hypothetical protein JNK65_02380 [Deltaproteobacteria bacterium]|nr:hypothetical protein [Deltaproteobacteria bacterium]
MKSVPLKDLKENLSYWAEEAAHGEKVQVTKYNKPYIMLGPTEVSFLHQGIQSGREPLRSVLRQGTKGKYLDILSEDRNEE